jgi:predicted molibdopterin-dependent oxidoreductase YjgC
MSSTFYWIGGLVSFHPGETIAAAMRRADVEDFGLTTGGLRARYFCGVGACQACLISVNGASPVEACLTPAKAGLQLSSATPLSEVRHHV